MIKILCINSRKVSDFLRCSVEFNEELNERKECDAFLKEYKEYFKTTDKDKLKEFYERTGLILKCTQNVGRK